VSEIKNIDLEFKADGEGKVSAVFSVFNTLDSDGDVVIPEAIKSGFKSGSVPMVWAHKWDMPIGKGAIKQDGDKATFEGEFFMDTESGKEAYNLVKAMGDLQQWSFGYRVNDSERGKFKSGDKDVDARYLKDLSVYEVSPVLVGANQDTYTMAIKSNKELLEEMASEKGVLGNSTFLENEEPEEEQTEEEKSTCCGGDNCAPAVAESSDEKSYGNCDYDKTGKCAKDMKKSDDIENSEEVSKTFSDEVKDVLAALHDLMTRTNAIAMLRAKDGRKLGVKATEALRAVQEDLSDAWTEIDQFIEQVGTEGALEQDLEDEQAEDIEDVVEEPTDLVDTEEVAVEAEPEDEVEKPAEESDEAEVTEEVPVDNTESVENDELDDEVWIESQRLIADAIDVEAQNDEV
jgi:HK97 family phage prohead protease|tara:strand:- start:8176 stop:9384 length:1209 start_codon:yes stop_codon:yes gene_type:complete